MADKTVGKTTGGKRVKGDLNETQRKQREACLRSIKAIWKIGQLDDAFPPGTKPQDPGQSTLINIRLIANKVNDLATAKLLFANECKDATGHPIPLGFTHSKNIAEALKKREAETPKQPPSPRARARNVPYKTFTSSTPAPKVPTLVAPSLDARAPFSIGRGMNQGNTSIVVPVKSLQESSSVSITKKREHQPERFGEPDNLETAPKKLKAMAPTESLPKMDSNINGDKKGPIPAGDTNKPLNCYNDYYGIDYYGMEELDRMMAEHRRANDEFFGRTVATSQDVPDDTIVVDVAPYLPYKQHEPAVPSKASKPLSKLEKQPNGYERKDGVSAAPVAKMIAKADTPREEQCLKVPQVIHKLLNTYNVRILAGRDRPSVVQRVKDVFDRSFAQLEIDLAGIFHDADKETEDVGEL